MSSIKSILRLGCKYAVGGHWLSDHRAVASIRDSLPLDVLFFCTAEVDEQWLRSTLEECRLRGMRCAMVAVGMDKLPLPPQFDAMVSPLGLRQLAARIAVTSSSGVPAWIMPKVNRRIHMPHSLVSLHMAYPWGAFDGYDTFFCASSRHMQEVFRLDELALRPPRPCLPVGYGKGDLMTRRFAAGNTEDKPVRQEVLLAPSWGKGNILQIMGPELISALLDANYKVVLRPHPLVMTEGQNLLQAIRGKVGGRNGFSLESSHEEPRALYSADVMISDYSGAAYEYAFLRLRTVAFVDVAIKETNSSWRNLGLEPAELALRDQVGTLLRPRVNDVVDAVGELVAHSDCWSERIAAVRERETFNWGKCSAAAASAIADLL